jgi:dolichol-phosphate mannosyltransferase
MISIVIPVLNEEDNLPELQRRLLKASEIWEENFEVVFVDDGSTDHTPVLLRGFYEADSRFKALRLSRNFGHQVAISAGLEYATGDAVAIMDADLQDGPDELAQLLAKWREGYEVVYAVRRRRKENVFKQIAYWVFYRLLAWASSVRIPLDSGDFSVMDRRVVDVLNAMPERSRFVRGLRSWIGFRQIGIECERNARFAGEVKYTLGKLVRLALDGLVNFSERPLQLLSITGFVIAGLAFTGMVYSIISRVAGISLFGLKPADTPGWTSLILVILFIGGVQLIGMGIIGEYLGRVYGEVKRRPLYVVREELGFALGRDESLSHDAGRRT